MATKWAENGQNSPKTPQNGYLLDTHKFKKYLKNSRKIPKNTKNIVSKLPENAKKIRKSGQLLDTHKLF